jgi:putative NAD(P)-binding protein
LLLADHRILLAELRLDAGGKQEPLAIGSVERQRELDGDLPLGEGSSLGPMSKPPQDECRIALRGGRIFRDPVLRPRPERLEGRSTALVKAQYSVFSLEPIPSLSHRRQRRPVRSPNQALGSIGCRVDGRICTRSCGGSTDERFFRHAVVVIGAGQAGLAAGYHLARRGIDFTVLEASGRVSPGLYFLGIPFMYSFTSMLVLGAGRDAAHVVDRLAARPADRFQGVAAPEERSRVA